MMRDFLIALVIMAFFFLIVAEAQLQEDAMVQRELAQQRAENQYPPTKEP